MLSPNSHASATSGCLWPPEAWSLRNHNTTDDQQKVKCLSQLLEKRLIFIFGSPVGIAWSRVRYSFSTHILTRIFFNMYEELVHSYSLLLITTYNCINRINFALCPGLCLNSEMNFLFAKSEAAAQHHRTFAQYHSTTEKCHSNTAAQQLDHASKILPQHHSSRSFC